MPVFDITCKKCGRFFEDCKVSFTDVDNINNNRDVEDFECPVCKNTIFKKNIAAHGRNKSNWGNW